MRGTKRGAGRGLALLAVLLLLWAAAGHSFYRLDHGHDAEGYRLLAELAAHKATLADDIEGPRVLIAGGSNAYYGLDAAAMEERLGVPVVNLALPFGAHHHEIALDILEEHMRRGDVVVFSSGSAWESARPPSRRAREFDAYLDGIEFPDYHRRFSEPPLPWRALPETGPLVFAAAQGFGSEPGRSWIADTDHRGTFIACQTAPVVLPRHYAKDAVNAELAAALRREAERLRTEGIRFAVALPWLYIRDSDRERWTGFRARFVEALAPAVPVIGSDAGALLHSDREAFCDSPLHLSKQASQRRSAAVAEALRPLIAAAQSAAMVDD